LNIEDTPPVRIVQIAALVRRLYIYRRMATG
jgi:hypothetical protein